MFSQSSNDEECSLKHTHLHPFIITLVTVLVPCDNLEDVWLLRFQHTLLLELEHPVAHCLFVRGSQLGIVLEGNNVMDDHGEDRGLK